MATKQELEERVAELEAQLAASDGPSWTSPSGRTHASIVGSDSGAVVLNLHRDGRQANRFELNRELELIKEE